VDQYQQFIHKSRYARWLPEEGRRETWEETVTRYVDFFKERGQLKGKDYNLLKEAILHLDVMPSMRCMMTAGAALVKTITYSKKLSYTLM